MKQKLGLTVILVISLIVGVVIGHQVRVACQPDAAPMEELLRSRVPEVDMFLGADIRTVETTFDEWIYPGSKSSGSDSTMSGDHNGLPFEFQTRTQMWTSDDFETVTGHYSKLVHDLLGMGEDDDWSLSPNGSGAVGVNGVLVSFAMNENQNRPLQVGDIGLQAKNCNLHVTITRGETEDSTYIHVMFSKWSVPEESE